MAKPLIPLLLACWWPFALAQTNDPTRPPAQFLSEETLAEMGGGTEKAVPGLQSIIRRHGAKPLAVINGEAIPVGGRVGEWVVLRIEESAVVLRGAQGRETLTLSPDIQKTMRRQGVAGKRQ